MNNNKMTMKNKIYKKLKIKVKNPTKMKYNHFNY